MNKRERKLIANIYKDCLKMKRLGQLTDFGEGQLMLCKLLLKTEN